MITIYQKPTCSTCRETVKLVQASGQAYRTVNYYETRFTAVELKRLLKKGGLSAKDVLRTTEEIYKSLGLARKELTDEALVDLMIAHPDLIQRPLVEKGDTVILARPPETVKRLL